MADAKLTELITTLEEQERTLRFPYFTAVDAFEIGVAVRQKFRDGQEGGRWKTTQGCLVSVQTFHGHTLFAAICGGEEHVTPTNWEWVEGKKDVVRRSNHSSFLQRQKTLAAGNEPEKYARGGGFPVWIRGCPSAPYAIIVVSGLSEEDDHQLIADVVAEYIPKMKPLGQ